MKTVIEFDHEKATQALNYLARKEGGKISKLKAVKLIWMVDRYHLRKYGRPVTNDSYFAMKFGPVGSAVKDLAECSDFLGDNEQAYLNEFLVCDTQHDIVGSIKEVDEDVFSESELDALDSIYSQFGSDSPLELTDFSHQYPEWAKFRSEIESGAISRASMSYSDFFSNPENQENDFFRESPERLSASKESFEEHYKLANFWI